DIVRIDLDGIELERVQLESDYETAQVRLRTAKIQLVIVLNDRALVEQFDVTGSFDFSEQLMPLDDFRNVALATRPDLRAAIQAIDKAKTDHQLAIANGSTDPIFSMWVTHNPSFNNPFDNETLGASISIPLRILAGTRGKKERPRLDIGRAERIKDATQAQLFSDVDSAYATLVSAIALLRPYKATYLGLATRVRKTVSFAY